MEGRVALLDLRGVEEIYVGSRFMVYLLFPDCNAGVHVVWDYGKENVVCSVGHSVVNRTCRINVGCSFSNTEGAAMAGVERANCTPPRPTKP